MFRGICDDSDGGGRRRGAGRVARKAMVWKAVGVRNGFVVCQRLGRCVAMCGLWESITVPVVVGDQTVPVCVQRSFRSLLNSEREAMMMV